MKKRLKPLLLVALIVCTTLPSWGQATTEGSDFWVTFLQVDQDANHDLKLELTITSRTNCNVTIENPYTNYSQTENVTAGQSKTIKLYEGNVLAQNARQAMSRDGKVCYAVNSEQKDQCALHVTAKDSNGKPVKISLFASNYKKATFDATNVLPTTSLMDEYVVQTYTPSDHGGVGATQGSHFAIIAAEDGVVVDYWPTVATTGHSANTKVTTPTLNKGEVWYVWTGKKDGEPGDLSGTRVVARDGKKIAVFQGCPHTNIPYQIKQRDHIFSQAMPTAFWGSRFVLTSSKERKKDIIRVLALYDHTNVFINDELVHTFNFNANPKHYFEFVIGENGDYANNGSCYLTTSCPCAVHLFMASQEFDEVSNGDPAMLWVNPIEQRIDQITFATYNSSNGVTQHYTNIVTDRPELMTLDGTSIASDFKKVDGNSDFSYAQLSLGTNATSHTLKSAGSTFIAHVYGFTDNESYGYSAGSATVGRQISVNDIAFESGEKAKGIDDAPTFCVKDTVIYDLRDISGGIYRIVLDFGDGTRKDTAKVHGQASNEPFLVTIKHTYPSPGWYDASAIVYGEEFCTQPAFTDTIPIIFRVVRPDTVIGEVTKDTCVSLESYKEKPAYWDKLIANGKIDTVQEHCYDDVVLNIITYRRETEEYKDTLRGWNEVYSPYNGYTYYESTDVVDDSLNTYGCTHYIRYYVDVIQCLDMSFSSDALSLCPGENVLVAYTKSKGDIKDEQGRFVVPGLIDTIISIPNYNTQIGELTLPTKDLKTPGYYTGTLTVEDKNCDTKQYQINLIVNYPSDIFQFKFNNVLAVYQNKGYQFTTYQWYVNGMPVDGATSSILYLGQNVTFKEGDIVFVMLTDKNGMTLPSCPQILSDIDPDMDNDALNQVPARKMLINSQFVIRKGDTDYDIYGQKVR